MSNFHAWYSKTADQKCGSAVWATPDGGRVKATAVASSREWGDSEEYVWPDKAYIGEVTHCIEAKPKG